MSLILLGLLVLILLIPIVRILAAIHYESKHNTQEGDFETNKL